MTLELPICCLKNNLVIQLTCIFYDLHLILSSFLELKGVKYIFLFGYSRVLPHVKPTSCAGPCRKITPYAFVVIVGGYSIVNEQPIVKLVLLEINVDE